MENLPSTNDYDAHRDLPSYAYALAHKEFALRPSLPLLNNARPMMLTPPSSPQKVFGTTFQRKRKASQLTTPSPPSSLGSLQKPKKEESENVKKLKTSPALKHLSIFTHAAFAEEEEGRRSVKAMNEAFESASVEDTDMESSSAYPPSLEAGRLQHPRPLSGKKIDLDVLLSNMPAESPYPPTPRSTAMPPLTFSSTIPSSSSFSSCSTSSMSPSSTFSSSFSSTSSSFGSNHLDDEEEYHIKEDLSTRLGLGSIGLGIGDISIFSAAAPEGGETVPRGMLVGTNDKDVQGRTRMTAVVHTSQGMTW